jgi:CubicO group peptidase (beta-lactamase class C family)
MATALLVLADRGAVGLDDPLAAWLPELPDAEAVTLRMLADMTAGYNDFVANEGFVAAFLADPFRQWTAEERIALGLATPRFFAPGTNWNYAHTNYVILGRALEQATGTPLAALLRALVLDPLGLRHTQSWDTPAIPEPVLHAFSSERRQALGVPAGTRFYEEATYWNPSWILAEGAIQTTDIADMAATAVAVGEGTLLSPASHAAQVEPRLVGFGSPVEGCASCTTLTEAYSYGLGVVLNGPWIVQTPLFAGYRAVEAYLPAAKLAIAVATTFGEGAFDEQGNYRAAGPGHAIAARIGAALAPAYPLPTRG